MDKKKIEELIRLVEESDVGELTVSGLFGSVKIVKEAPPAVAAAVTARGAAATPEPDIRGVAAVEETPEAADRDSGLVPIESPMVGTYYEAPSPDSPPYVRQGDRVSKGQVVCIVEAMKLLNEIESEVSGTIVRVAVENAQAVEFGQALFMVEPD